MLRGGEGPEACVLSLRPSGVAVSVLGQLCEVWLHRWCVLASFFKNLSVSFF